jgi:nitroreductase
MDLLKAIFTRRSVRNFLPKPVPQDKLNTIIQAAMAAPSANNEQPWHFILIESQKLRERIESIHPHAKMSKQAPVAILLCGDLTVAEDPKYWMEDCAAACQNLLLAAHGLNLGAVWCGIYPNQTRMEAFSQMFHLPDTIIPFAIIPVGVPSKIPKPVDRFKKERVHRDFWGTAYFP